MSSNAHRRLLADRRIPRSNRVGVISSVTPSDRTCNVVVQDGEILAFLTDQTIDWAVVGATAILQRIGDTYFVAATVGGTGTGGVGVSLGPELLPNNGFEYGGTNPTGWSWWPWVSGEYEVTRDTTPGEAVSGSARMLAVLSAGTDVPKVILWPSQVTVDPGVTYQLSAWVKASALEASLVTEIQLATAPTAEGAVYFGTDVIITTVATVTSPGSAYQLLTGNVTIPPGHQYARPYLRCIASDSIAAPVSVSWDEASLRQRITS